MNTYPRKVVEMGYPDESDWVKDIADFTIEIAREKGVDFAEARLEVNNAEIIILNKGNLMALDKNQTKGLGLRIIAKGGMAFGAIPITDGKHSILDYISKTIKLAERVGERYSSPITLTEEPSHTDNWKVPVREGLWDISSEEKVTWIKSVDSDILDSCGEDHIPSRMFIFQNRTKNGFFVDSRGSKINSNHSLMKIYSLMTAKGTNGSEQSWVELGGSGGWELRNEMQIKEDFIDRAKELVKAAEIAKPINSGSTIDMVVGGEVAGIIAHENAGHPSEADRIWGREAAQAGESYLVDKKIGDQLGSENVTILDDPTIPKSLGYYKYDSEGVKARPKILIKNGKYEEMMHNRETASKFSIGKSNAAARAVNWYNEPIIRMSNTHFAIGDYKPDELTEDINDGLFMKSFQEWNIDDRRWQCKYVGNVAYRIKKGEITDEMVKRPVLEISTASLFNAIDGCSNKLEFIGATCGKSDPMQGVPVWMGGPNVRLRNIRLG